MYMPSASIVFIGPLASTFLNYRVDGLGLLPKRSRLLSSCSSTLSVWISLGNMPVLSFEGGQVFCLKVNALSLLRPFTAITISTQHLAVIGSRVATLAPRCYMIGMHLTYFEMLAAIRANTFLALVSFYSVSLIEIADVKLSFITRENIRVYTLFICDIFVYKQCRYSFLNVCC